MDSPDWPAWRDEQAAGDPELLAFWENLREGWELFERTRALPAIRVEPNGRYAFTGPSLELAQDLRQ
jgi:hypothetical protein